MKGLLSGIILLAFFFLGAAPGQGADGVREAPVRLRSVQADFIQEKHLKILVRPIISQGRFVFQAPGSLRWEYREPFHSILLMFEGRVRKFSEKNGQLVEDRGLRLDAMQVVLSEISGWLDGRFTDNAAFDADFENDRTIQLTPKDKSMQAFIIAIELKLGDQPGLLDSVTIFEGPESFTRLLFSHAVINQSIPNTLFTAP